MFSAPLRHASSLILLLLLCPAAFSQSDRLLITVTDENHVAVPGAQVSLQRIGTNAFIKRETDFAGRCELFGLPHGAYQLHIQKPGFYQLTQPVQVGAAGYAPTVIDAALTHQKEVKEVVDVVESPPVIDPDQIADTQTLSDVDVQNIPYPVSRDFRNVLPFIPGVVSDGLGQPHVAGGETYQMQDTLDSFDVTDPVDGLLHLRVSTDAIRALEVQSTRYSAQFGRASAGVLNITTGIGDDHLRYSATDVIPSYKFRNGLKFDKWQPRGTFSGPLKKGKIWFYNAVDGEYDENIIRLLPSSGNRAPIWRFSNLAKLQTNITPSNILTGSFLFNRAKFSRVGLSLFTPISATVGQDQTSYVGSIKDQHYFHSGNLLETGVAVFEQEADEIPQGTLPYTLSPGGVQGNFFRTSQRRSRRTQGVANLFFHPVNWHGKHQLKFGFDVERIAYHQFFLRRPISTVRGDRTLDRQVLFPEAEVRYRQNNFQGGTYAQDRWSPVDRLLIEGGLRFDEDQIIRNVLVSPRLAATYMLDKNGNTKLSAGVGLFYDATNLALLTRPLQGTRLDLTYASDGVTLAAPPIATTFTVDQRTLVAPRSLNWSLSIERKLPHGIYTTVEYLDRRGTHEFTYVPLGSPLSTDYFLTNTRQDHYRSLLLTARYTFRKSYPFLFSYSRSSARTNAVLNYSLDNLVLGAQGAGPLPWDSPDRFISWGMMPLPSIPVVHKLELAYSVEWHDGYPFSIFNQDRQIVGLQRLRFPRFFALNTYIEKRFNLLKYNLALRMGWDNVTNNRNPGSVDSNIDSATYLHFSNLDRRTFVARIRFLGRKK